MELCDNVDLHCCLFILNSYLNLVAGGHLFTFLWNGGTGFDYVKNIVILFL